MGLLSMVRGAGLRPEIPVAINPEEDDFSKEYSRVANKIGTHVAHSTAVLVSDLVNVLADECIAVYALARVEKYMDAKGRWSWFPMARNQRVFTIPRETTTPYRTLYGDTERSQYDKPIPLPVLLTAEKIIDRLGTRVSFYVAALNNKPDPFLGVVLNDDPSRKIFVVERWDEPGFRG